MRPLCVAHFFIIEGEGIMAKIGKGIEIESSHLSIYRLKTVIDS